VQAGSWILDLKRRIEHLEKLNREYAECLPDVHVWLGGLFQPGAFLTAMRQWTARLVGLPLENLKLRISIGSNVSDVPPGPKFAVRKLQTFYTIIDKFLLPVLIAPLFRRFWVHTSMELFGMIALAISFVEPAGVTFWKISHAGGRRTKPHQVRPQLPK
jgi:hypothetical protein